MSAIIGQFPLDNPMRRIIRAPLNPLDVSTLVSIMPREVDEVKHTLQPGRFIIPPGSERKPSVLVITASSWWREVDEDQPLLEIPVYSVNVAESVVKDYCQGILGISGDAKPGLFFVPGAFKSEEILAKFPGEMALAIRQQKQWFTNLVKLADSLWARSQGNPLAIGDDMRMAANELGLEGKEWMKDQQTMDTARCKACGSLRNPEYPICPNCRNIDMSHPLAKELKFAQ